MKKPQTYYGYKDSCGLAGLYQGGSKDFAKINADNYRLFAQAAYFDARPWQNAL